MQTSLLEQFRITPEGQEADAILRSCVHCGFCLATCPTYQLLGDELDSPRGRIYLIKQVLEGATPTAKTQLHLDRCLTCRACETTCPSGVRYGRLADIGRGLVEARVPRSPWQRLQRWLLRHVMAYPRRFGFFLRIGQLFRPLLPQALATKLPPRQHALPPTTPTATFARRMLMLDGCVQSVATPNTNAAAVRVLADFGIELIAAPGAGCCGALDYHLGAHQAGLDRIRRNIDAWWPLIEGGVEALVMTASGCGATVREYGQMLAHDPNYAQKAERITTLTRDLGEIVAAEDRSAWNERGAGRRIAYHAPCTLQHAQKLPGLVERILRDAGYQLTPVIDSHLCCGSAGTYSILQPKLSRQLLNNKLTQLQAGEPELIVTANVGCQLHLQTGSGIPVKHWIELFDAPVPSTGRDHANALS